MINKKAGITILVKSIYGKIEKLSYLKKYAKQIAIIAKKKSKNIKDSFFENFLRFDIIDVKYFIFQNN